MNSLAEIAQALDEGADQLEADQELSIPIDSNQHVHVLRRSGSDGLLLAVSRRFASNEGDAPARREALLRLAADTRWTDTLVGGLDTEGAERVMAARDGHMDALQAELLLARMFKRMGPAQESADVLATDSPTASGAAARAYAASWLAV